MEELSKLIQSGGSQAMDLINTNQSGGAAQIVFLVLNLFIPIIFFFVYYFWHLGLTDDRVEKEDEGDEDKDKDTDRDYVIWGKMSIKVLLFMMFLCFLFGWVLSFYLGIPVIGAGGGVMKIWWKIAFGMMAASGAATIFFGGLRSTAYQYFNDELYDDKDKLKNTCVAFGCGYAPHDGAPVVRGAEY